MKYWYLKNGDVVGPMSAEEIKKDEFFAEDCLVCPEDKAEQADFWKSPQNYAQDFFPVLQEEQEKESSSVQNQTEAENTKGEAEMEIPMETSLEEFPAEEKKENPSKEPFVRSSVPPPPTSKEPIITKTGETEKNPFESDRPQIAPNIEDTISSHVIAPRLDADGDTLLEDIPAKAILKDETQESEKEEQFDFAAQSSLSSPEDTLDDAPILNIFERTDKESNKTREIADISEHIYDTYGTDAKVQKPLVVGVKEEESLESLPKQEEIRKKNNKIYLLVLLMFILVIVALLLALFGSNEGKNSKSQQTTQNKTAALPMQTVSSPLQNQEESEIFDTPTTDASAFFTAKTNNTEQDRALTKVKKFILPNSKNLEEYLSNKYADYQTSWVADVLSGRNYYVHFYASKIRQEPIVYSFSIDLDKNEINGLNNLGMDLLVKGE